MSPPARAIVAEIDNAGSDHQATRQALATHESESRGMQVNEDLHLNTA